MIEIKITVPDLARAIESLATAIAAQKNQSEQAQPAAPVDQVSAQVQTQVVPTPVQPITPVSPAPVQPIAPVSPAPVQPTAQAPVQIPKLTMAAISREGAELVNQGKMAEILALLAKYGVQAVNQIPKNQYEAFAADLRALGANI